MGEQRTITRMSHQNNLEIYTHSHPPAVRLTGADIPVAVQVPIHGKFCHSVGVFAGLVADLLLKTFRNLAGVFLVWIKLTIALSKLGHRYAHKPDY